MIATSVKVDIKGVDEKVIEKAGAEGYFTGEKALQKKGEEAFFAQGGEGKPEKKKMESGRVEDQKAVDKVLLGTIKKEAHLLEYLGSSFSLRKGDRPHEMVF